jgi:uncharacterized membrane protein YheB (UPF0754 family)
MMKRLRDLADLRALQQARQELLMAMLVEQMLRDSGRLSHMQAHAEAWVNEYLGQVRKDWPGWTYPGMAANQIQAELKQAIPRRIAELVAERVRQRAGG